MENPAVLVVDDEPFVRISAVDAFQNAGFEVVQAGDAASALAILRSHSGIELICTDVQMPGELDGIDLALIIRRRCPKLRVIIVSGSKHGERLPNVPFVSKPFHATGLVEIARAELAAARGSARPSRPATLKTAGQ
jgi:DNA-binding NtrC family response regulator